MNMITQHSEELREFVRDVQHRAGLERYEEAHQLAMACVQVLGQAISEGQANRLAQLPKELSDMFGQT